MAELEAQHGVRRFAAVLKRDNLRSMRLLERLGFGAGSAQEHQDAGADADEAFMQTRAATGTSGEAMPIELDHTIVPSHTQVASARRLAELLGVPWAERSIGPFSAVYVNAGLTLDFIQTDDAFPVYHFCFRVDEASFDAILGRIQSAGIAYRSAVRGAVDRQVNRDHGGRLIYWNEPDGHQWEMLTVSYARPQP